LYRSSRDISGGTAITADFSFVKHAAAQELSGRTLMAYSERDRQLVTPLGAALPGLYERAVTLETGLPGFVQRDFVVYRDVPGDLAGRLAKLLST
jgi:hypothetical protein